MTTNLPLSPVNTLFISSSRACLISASSGASGNCSRISAGVGSLLMNVTSGYHYHTIVADDEQTLDLIQEELGKLGFLAKLQEYEPVDFWHKG